MKHDPCPVSGLDMFHVLYGSGFKFDRSGIADEMYAVADKIEKEYAETNTGLEVGGVRRLLFF